MQEIDIEEFDRKNIYEIWKDKELPSKLQKDIDSFSSCGHTQDEKVFRAGFLLGNYIGKKISKNPDWTIYAEINKEKK